MKLSWSATAAISPESSNKQKANRCLYGGFCTGRDYSKGGFVQFNCMNEKLAAFCSFLSSPAERIAASSDYFSGSLLTSANKATEPKDPARESWAETAEEKTRNFPSFSLSSSADEGKDHSINYNVCCQSSARLRTEFSLVRCGKPGGLHENTETWALRGIRNQREQKLMLRKSRRGSLQKETGRSNLLPWKFIPELSGFPTALTSGAGACRSAAVSAAEQDREHLFV